MSEDTSCADESKLSDSERREAIRERYGAVSTSDSCCGSDNGADQTAQTSDSSCCGTSESSEARKRGYDTEQVEAVSSTGNLGLGCGNPTGLARLQSGDIVLDLGAGAGFDCFLASREVGQSGRVIGVDMTPDMVERARANAHEEGISNVEFRLGEIEHLPVPDESVDVIISNCVINLSADKQQVFSEAYRVLAPGGTIAITDVVRTAEMPSDLKTDPEAVSACVGGASSISQLEEYLETAGFEDIRIEPKSDDEFIREWLPEREPSEYVAPARIRARKPTSD